MISDLELAQAANDCYSPSAVWDESWTRDDIHVNLKRVRDLDVIAFRGSIDTEDWLRDFRGWPIHDPVLGFVHEGFMEGMAWVGLEVLPVIGYGRPFAVTGHSLGAARALIFAGMAVGVGQGRPNGLPVRLTTFGTPKPGMGKLSKLLKSGGFPITCYRNGPDPVADVPFSIPYLFPYQKPVEDTMAHVPPENPEDPFAWHHCPLYLRGLS